MAYSIWTEYANVFERNIEQNLNLNWRSDRELCILFLLLYFTMNTCSHVFYCIDLDNLWKNWDIWRSQKLINIFLENWLEWRLKYDLIYCLHTTWNAMRIARHSCRLKSSQITSDRWLENWRKEKERKNLFRFTQLLKLFFYYRNLKLIRAMLTQVITNFYGASNT